MLSANSVTIFFSVTSLMLSANVHRVSLCYECTTRNLHAVSYFSLFSSIRGFHDIPRPTLGDLAMPICGLLCDIA